MTLITAIITAIASVYCLVAALYARKQAQAKPVRVTVRHARRS